MATTVVYADASDGYVYYSDPVYATARGGGGTPSVSSVASVLYVGQLTGFLVMESFLGFDTSPIPDADTVSAAILRGTSAEDSSATDFTMQARLRDWGATLETTDFVPGADLAALTLLATYATVNGFVVDTGYDFADVAMPANVNKTGFTRMVLASSRTVDNITPTGSEYVSFRAADTAGTSSDPVLTVTHAAGGTEIIVPLAVLTLVSYAPAIGHQIIIPVSTLGLVSYAPAIGLTGNLFIEVPRLGLVLLAFAPAILGVDDPANRLAKSILMQEFFPRYGRRGYRGRDHKRL